VSIFFRILCHATMVLGWHCDVKLVDFLDSDRN
jgi:hypothetical protein